jgi:hypothetical protein
LPAAVEQGARLGSGGFQERRGDAFALLEQRQQKVLDVDTLVTLAGRRALRLAQRVLRTFRQSIDIHFHPIA